MHSIWNNTPPDNKEHTSSYQGSYDDGSSGEDNSKNDDHWKGDCNGESH